MHIDNLTGEILGTSSPDELARHGSQRLTDDPCLSGVPPRAPFLRTPYNYDRDRASLETGLAVTRPSMAQQQFAEECDINTIVRRFGLTGQLPENVRLPHYGDFTQVTDYQTALNQVRQAEEAFMELPAAVRAAFHNNPQELLEAVEDPSRASQLRDLGLLKGEVPAATSGPLEPIQSDPGGSPPAPPKIPPKASGKPAADQHST